MEINYPTLEELAPLTGGVASLYLAPSDGGDTAEIVVFHDYSRTSTPMPAWHMRWLHIGTYGDSVVPSALAEWLRAAKETWLALDSLYLGSEWDGSSHIGRWGDTESVWHPDMLPIDDLPSYMAASDYFGRSGDWAELSEYYGETDVDALADEIARDAKSNGAILRRDDLTAYLEDAKESAEEEGDA